MTVQELMEELKTMDPNAEVVVVVDYSSGNAYYKIERGDGKVEIIG